MALCILLSMSLMSHAIRLSRRSMGMWFGSTPQSLSGHTCCQCNESSWNLTNDCVSACWLLASSSSPGCKYCMPSGCVKAAHLHVFDFMQRLVFTLLGDEGSRPTQVPCLWLVAQALHHLSAHIFCCAHWYCTDGVDIENGVGIENVVSAAAVLLRRSGIMLMLLHCMLCM